MSTKEHMYKSKSIGEMAQSIAIGIKWQKRLSRNLTEEEREEFEMEIMEWSAQKVFMDKSKSFDYAVFRKNKI